MNREDARRLADLSRHLGAHPHEVLLAAATMADHPELGASEVLSAVRAKRFITPAATPSLALLRTPPAAYAPGHVTDALASLWGTLPLRTP